jgi:hypothetical protein
MTLETLLKKFDYIDTWKQDDYEKPHKAITLLYALAQFQARTHQLRFSAVEEPLRKLIGDFDRPTGSCQCVDPFWRLKNDTGHFWELRGNVPADRLLEINPPARRDLLKWKVSAEFTGEIQKALRENPQWVVELAEKIYRDHPVGTSREEVFKAVGLEG